MAAGDIIIPGNTITPEIMQKIAAEVTKLINTNAKDPGQWEVVTSTNGITSLPVLQVLGSTYKLVLLAVSTLQGVNGREVELQMNAERTAIQWRYVAVAGSDLQPTEWRTLIEVSLLKGDPGETPVFRTGSSGIEWKYESEAEDTWRVLVAYDILKLKFSDLSTDNIAEFWRNVPADVMAEFQKPATDAAAEVRKEMAQISQEASQTMTDLRQLEATVSDQEAIRETFYTQVQAKEQARQNDEVKRQEAAKEHAEAEALRKQEEAKRNEIFDTKVKEATDATGKAIEAEKNAAAATDKANEAAGKANTATDRLNALSDHRDEIRDGYWWRWNEETGEWYNTGEIAKGNVMYATFDLDPQTGVLTMITDPEYTGANFKLDQNGKLQVII